MNQIWFGLVWISPKESKPQRNKKTKNPKRKKEAKKTKNDFQTSLNMPRSK